MNLFFYQKSLWKERLTKSLFFLHKRYFSNKTKTVLLTFIIIAPFVTLWLLFHLPSKPPGMTDPHISYINMTNMYIYFLILLLVLFVNPSLDGKMTFIALAIVLITYPFLFIYSRYPGTLNPPTGCFPYLKAILVAKKNSWFYVLSHPWHTFESTHPHGGNVIQIEQLLRTKLPGFAITAKLLSYFVFGKWTYMVSVVGISIFSSFLLVKALIPQANERKWYIICMLSTTVFLIQPYGVEQISAIYLAISIFFMYKFKQNGNPYSLLASIVSAVFLFLDLTSSIFVFPFLIAYAFIENRYIRKMLLYSVICSITLLFLLSMYFNFTSNVSLFKYYFHRSTETFQYSAHQDWVWHFKSLFFLMCILYGAQFFLCLLPLVFHSLSKETILMLAVLVPAGIFTWIIVPSEAYRQLYLNGILLYFVFFRYISYLHTKNSAMLKLLSLKIIVGYSVLHAIMIHKFYLIPEVMLNPMAGDTAPSEGPWGDGWSLGLREFQKVTPMVFIVTFVMWLLIIIFKDRIRAILADGFKRGPRIC